MCSDADQLKNLKTALSNPGLMARAATHWLCLEVVLLQHENLLPV